MKLLILFFFLVGFNLSLFGQIKIICYGSKGSGEIELSYLTKNDLDSIQNKNILAAFARSSLLKYPDKALDNCISGNVNISFIMNENWLIDTSSIKIAQPVNGILDSMVYNFIKHWSINRLNPLYPIKRFPIHLRICFKSLKCDDPLWRKDEHPINGKYIGYFKRTGNIRAEGFYKNGEPDSLWSFYDSTGMTISKGFCKNCRQNLVVGKLPDEFDGIKHGVWDYFNADGKLIRKDQLVCDELLVSQDYYPENGSIKRIKYYPEIFSDKTITISYYSNGKISEIYQSDSNTKFSKKFQLWIYSLFKKETSITSDDKSWLCDIERFEYFNNGLIKKRQFEHSDGKVSWIECYEYSEDGSFKKHDKYKKNSN
jgi:antitoxin component YwqK of YwqJK toxin-antitoxin module